MQIIFILSHAKELTFYIFTDQNILITLLFQLVLELS